MFGDAIVFYVSFTKFLIAQLWSTLLNQFLVHKKRLQILANFWQFPSVLLGQKGVSLGKNQIYGNIQFKQKLTETQNMYKSLTSIYTLLLK